MELTPRVIRGDAKALPLDEESVHCVVTSPPYWGLRAYGGDPGMIGLEPTIDEHLDNLVQVFREVRRVLRNDGTLWLNYGDCYGGGNQRAIGGNVGTVISGDLHGARTSIGQPKQLLMLPARVAMALQADGWWVRSEIIWHKPNPMPESVTDRPTSAHEKVFLLSKRARYFYDADAVRTASEAPAKMPDGWDTGPGAHGSVHRNGREKGQRSDGQQCNGANLRNVWSIPTQGYSGAHFATFPLALAKRCILAGCPEGGTVFDPFGGSGTVGIASEQLGRKSILNEINADYCTMAQDRINDTQPMMAYA